MSFACWVVTVAFHPYKMEERGGTDSRHHYTDAGRVDGGLRGRERDARPCY